MPKIGFINGSPRATNSLSANMIDWISESLSLQKHEKIVFNTYKLSKLDDLTDSFEELFDCDTVIVVSPLYVDALPSTLLSFMRDADLYQKECGYQKSVPFYALINCGFIEGKQNHIALDILSHYATHMNWQWSGGIGLGGGEMFKSTKEKIPKQAKMMQPVYQALDTFVACIADSSPIPSSRQYLLINQKFPKYGFIFMGSIGWITQARHFKVNLKQLFHKPHTK